MDDTYSPRSPAHQTFVNGIVAFRVLPRPQFAALMAKLFPIYFSMQAALPAVLALTYPASKNPFGVAGGVAGVLDSSNRWSVLAPLAGAFLCAVGNLVVVGPATTRVMGERRDQGMLSFCVFFFEGVAGLTRNREEGWQEVLRCRAAFTGDAGAEQKVRHAARRLVAAQPRIVHCVPRVRRHALLAAGLNVSGRHTPDRWFMRRKSAGGILPTLCALDLRRRNYNIHTDRQAGDPYPCQIRVIHTAGKKKENHPK